MGTGTRALELFGVRRMEGAAAVGADGGDGVAGLSLSFPLKSLMNPDFFCFKLRGSDPVAPFGAGSSAAPD